jgi:hypothetical protein
VFYTRLGVTPDEAGLSYTSLLSGSTIEILVIFVVLTITFMALIYELVFFSLYLRFIPIIFAVIKRNFEWRNLTSLNMSIRDQAFKQRLSILEEVATRFPEMVEMWHFGSFAEMEIWMRRTRELKKLSVRTEEESAELDTAARKHGSSMTHMLSRFILHRIKRWIRRWGPPLAALYLLIAIFIGLPALAFVQSGQVLGGREYVGAQFGLFNYSAELVRVNAISQAQEQGIQSLVGKSLFLIGQNTQFVILYSPATHSITRVPIASVIVTSAR